MSEWCAVCKRMVDITTAGKACGHDGISFATSTECPNCASLKVLLAEQERELGRQVSRQALAVNDLSIQLEQKDKRIWELEVENDKLMEINSGELLDHRNEQATRITDLKASLKDAREALEKIRDYEFPDTMLYPSYGPALKDIAKAALEGRET